MNLQVDDYKLLISGEQIFLAISFFRASDF